MKKLRLLLLVSLPFFISACDSFGATDNTPPPAALTAFTPALNVKPQWSSSAGSGVGKDYLKLGPVVAGNKLLTADVDGRVTATDVGSGQKFWQVDAKDSITSGPGVGDDIVVVTTANAEAVAYNMNGKFLWRSKIPNQSLATPQVAQGRVVIKLVDGQMVALAANNGASLWTYAHGAPTLVLRSNSAPQIVGNEVLAGFSDGKLVAVTLGDGNLLWEQIVAAPQGNTQVEQMVDIAADPKINSGIVYVATYQGKIAATGMQTGQIAWQQDISTYTGMALSPRLVFVTDAQGTVRAFNRANGNVIWKQTQLANRNLTAPVVMGDSVVVGDSEGYLHWLAQGDGRTVARTQIANKSSIIAAPIVVGNSVIAVTNDGKLVAVRAG